MRILYVTNNYKPYSGGVVSVIAATAQELRALGHDVLIVTLDFMGTGSDESGVVRLYSPIRFWYGTNPMALSIFTRQQLRSIIATYKPDVVHVHHPFLLGWRAAQLAHAYHIPVVFTYHTDYTAFFRYIPLPKRLVQWIVLRRITQFFTYLNGLILPNPYLHAQDIPDQKPLRVCVTPSPLQRLYCHAQRPLKEPKPVISLLTVGRMVKEKNVAALLEAMRYVHHAYHFTLIGYGEQFIWLQHYAYKILGLSPDHVQFVHKPSKDFIAQAYAQADIFLFASQADVQPQVLSEAMAAGTPVIAFPGPWAQAIVKHGINGFIVPDSAAMAAVINDLALHAGWRHYLSMHAWQTGSAYHPDYIIPHLITLYQTVMADVAAQ